MWQRLLTGWDSLGSAAKVLAGLKSKGSLKEFENAAARLRDMHETGFQLAVSLNQAVDYQSAFDNFLTSAERSAADDFAVKSVGEIRNLQADLRAEYSRLLDSFGRQRQELTLLYQSLVERYQAKRSTAMNTANWIIAVFGILLTSITTVIAVVELGLIRPVSP